jgi:hypothetical protein
MNAGIRCRLFRIFIHGFLVSIVKWKENSILIVYLVVAEV